MIPLLQDVAEVAVREVQNCIQRHDFMLLRLAAAVDCPLDRQLPEDRDVPTIMLLIQSPQRAPIRAQW